LPTLPNTHYWAHNIPNHLAAPYIYLQVKAGYPLPVLQKNKGHEPDLHYDTDLVQELLLLPTFNGVKCNALKMSSEGG